MSVFDVAKWSEADIISSGEDIGVPLEHDDVKGVVEELALAFDADIGINWGTIHDAIRSYKEVE